MRKDNKEIVTRLTERKFRSNDPKKIAGKYLASRALRTWTEDFTDEDTGEIISIERNEELMKRGTYLTPEKVSELSFFFQSGDLKDVEVTTQVRPGTINTFYRACLCEATVYIFPAGVKKYLLHAISIGQAYDIMADYIELFQPGQSTIRGIKSMGEYSYIHPNKETDEDEMRNIVPFYKAQGSIVYLDEEHDELHPGKETYKFVLQANDVKEANDIVKQQLAKAENTLKEQGFRIQKVSTIAAQPYPIAGIVPRPFSEVYIKHYLENKK